MLHGPSISSLLFALMFVCRLTMISGSNGDAAGLLFQESQKEVDEQAYWQKNPTILISIDGFRPEYLERGITPHLSKLGKYCHAYMTMTKSERIHVFYLVHV